MYAARRPNLDNPKYNEAKKRRSSLSIFLGAWKRLSFFQISETVRVELLHMQLSYRLFESLLHLFCFVRHKESILRNIVNGFRHSGDRSSCVCFGFDNSRNPKRLNLYILFCSLCTHFR